jgi:AAA+ superfamily predicted ATPase
MPIRYDSDEIEEGTSCGFPGIFIPIARKLDAETEKKLLSKASLGDMSKLLTPTDLELSIIRDFLEQDKYTSINETVSFYVHHILQFNQSAFFESKGFVKVCDCGVDQNSITEVTLTTIPCDLDKTFVCYETGNIFYENKETKERIIISIRHSYDRRAVYYTITAKQINKLLWEEWLDFAKKNNFYKGKKIDANCGFLKINQKLTWENVILPEKIKKVIQRNVDSMYTNREILAKNGISVKRGILLAGSPGTGKTMVCKILCKELPMTTIYVLPSSIRNPSDIDRICEMAKDLSPTLLIFEDIDYIATDREDEGGNGWLSIQLMNQLDGLEEMNGVITLATTNLIEKIEKAIKNRPGRFDKIITIPVPDDECRNRMIRKFTERFILAEDCNIANIIERTSGMPGAYINHICEYAAMLAIEDGSIDANQIAIVKQYHFETAYDEIKDKDLGTGSVFEEPEPMGFFHSTPKRPR